MSEPLMLLLGAGSSYGYAPSVQDITTELLLWKSYRQPDPLSRDNPFIEKHANTSANDSRKPFFEALSGLLESRFERPRDHLHFERLIHVAELLASHFPLAHPFGGDDENRSLLAPMIQIREGLQPWDVLGYDLVAFAACRFVLDYVANFCNGKDAGSKSMVKGVKLLANRATMHVVSLNYDDLICQSEIDFYTGFVPEKDGYQVFNPTYPWPNDKHTLCQLHGSVLFGRANEEIMRDVVRYKDREEAKKSRIGAATGTRAQDGHSVPSSTEMITGLRKADKLLSRPYGTYLHAFREHALSCPHWLIIGYGGGDQHINDVLKQARRNWLSRTEWKGKPVDHRVVWVDKIDFQGQPTLTLEEYTLNFNKRMPVLDVLGEEVTTRMRQNTSMISRKVLQLPNGLGFVSDGVDWALGDGLPDVMSSLGL